MSVELPMAEENCGNCRFWHFDSRNTMRADCRRRPPFSPRGERSDDSWFPQTPVWQWCGEWEPRAVAADGPEPTIHEGSRPITAKVWPLTMTSYEVEEYTGVSRTTIFAMVSDGTFPRSVRVHRDLKWQKGEVDKWYLNLKAGRRKVRAKKVI